MIGDSIISQLGNLKSKDFNVEYKQTEKGYLYLIKEKEYKLELTINAPTWIGLEFYLLDDRGKTLLTYDINSDLYDLSMPKFHQYADEIESEIANFLKDLIEGKIREGTIKGKPAIIIPKKDEFLLIKKGWFLTSGKSYKDLETIEKTGEFRS